MNLHIIQFKYTTPQKLSFTNPLAMLVTFALKEVGKDNVTDDITKQIKKMLQKEQKEKVLIDEALMLAWVRTFTRRAHETIEYRYKNLFTSISPELQYN